MAVGERIGFIGAGQMAEALIGGMLSSQVCTASRIRASDPSAARRELMTQRFGIRVESDGRAVAEWADTVVLAVKPQVCAAVLADLAPHLSTHVLVSIAAGLRLSWLASRVPSTVRLIRVMPNAPALVGAGMSGIALHHTAIADDAALAKRLCGAVGRTVQVDEALLDAVTGLSGSGPAFVCVALEALADGGVKAGLPRDLAQRLAVAAATGAARLRQATPSSASPAVSTQRPNEQAWSAVVAKAVTTAAQRSQELGAACL